MFCFDEYNTFRRVCLFVICLCGNNTLSSVDDSIQRMEFSLEHNVRIYQYGLTVVDPLKSWYLDLTLPIEITCVKIPFWV